MRTMTMMIFCTGIKQNAHLSVNTQIHDTRSQRRGIKIDGGDPIEGMVMVVSCSPASDPETNFFGLGM